MLSSPSPVLAHHGRDQAVDLVRAMCVVAVVVLHSLMVGVSIDAQGPVFANAGDTGWWLIPVSWMLQVMPLFFMIGGFAGYTAYQRMQAHGGTGRAFVTGRLVRLLLPATAVIATAGVGLSVLTIVGVPAEFIATAGYRFGQPLWFLAVFLISQALIPVLARAHRAAPLITITALASAAVLVDVARAASGVDAIGFFNLAFVWLTMQQLGFLLADGRVDALSRQTRMRVGATAVIALAIFFVTGVYSPDLIANTNPPTTALLLVGAAHRSGQRTPCALHRIHRPARHDHLSLAHDGAAGARRWRGDVGDQRRARPACASVTDVVVEPTNLARACVGSHGPDQHPACTARDDPCPACDSPYRASRRGDSARRHRGSCAARVGHDAEHRAGRVGDAGGCAAAGNAPARFVSA